MESVSDMDRANAQLRRASSRLGCLANLWLICFWGAAVAVVLVVAYAYLS